MSKCSFPYPILRIGCYEFDRPPPGRRTDYLACAFPVTRWLASSFGFILGVLVLLSVALLFRYGSFSDAYLAANGAVLSLRVLEPVVQSPLAGDSVQSSILLKNLTSNGLTVHGSKSGCTSCVVLSGLPIAIQPHGTVTLPLEIRTDRSEAGKSVVKSIEFFTAPAGTPAVLSVKLNVSTVTASPPVLVPEPETHTSVSDFVKE